MCFPRVLFLFLSFLLLAAGLSAAQDIDSTNQTAQASTPIQDNSFLIEEAYNQADRVIQQISTFERLTNSRHWVYTQTDDWPVRSYKHQGSGSLAFTPCRQLRRIGCGGGARPSTIDLNWWAAEKPSWRFAPRLSVLFPTGDHAFARGSGGLGLQTNLPVSIQHSAHLVSPWNAGTIWIPRAR